MNQWLSGIPEEARTLELCRLAVSQNSGNYNYVPENLKSFELFKIAIETLDERLYFDLDSINPEYLTPDVLAYISKHKTLYLHEMEKYMTDEIYYNLALNISSDIKDFDIIINKNKFINDYIIKNGIIPDKLQQYVTIEDVKLYIKNYKDGLYSLKYCSSDIINYDVIELIIDELLCNGELRYEINRSYELDTDVIISDDDILTDKICEVILKNDDLDILNFFRKVLNQEICNRVSDYDIVAYYHVPNEFKTYERTLKYVSKYYGDIDFKEEIPEDFLTSELTMICFSIAQDIDYDLICRKNNMHQNLNIIETI